MRTTSSSHSSKGNQNKYFDDINKIWYKYDYLGYESLSEVIVSKILQANNINCLDYNFYTTNNKICCSSYDMREADEILISIRKLMYQENYELPNNISTVETVRLVVEFVENFTNLDNFGTYLSNMLYIDYVFLNEDRHFNNIQLLYNTVSNTFKPSKIFDNGASLLSDITVDYPLGKNINNMIKKVKAKPFSTDFNKQMILINK